METLSGVSTGTEDPFDALLSGLGGQALQPHQDTIIREAEGLIKKLA